MQPEPDTNAPEQADDLSNNALNASSENDSGITRSLVQRMIEDQKIEFSCDLHDGILQYLIAARMHVQAMQFNLESNQPISKEACSQLDAILKDGIDNGREWIGILRGERSLLVNNLNAEIRTLVDRLAATHQVDFKLSLSDSFQAIQWPVMIPRVLAKIVEQSLTNVARHAKATLVCIRCTTPEDETYRIEIEDNGIGDRQGQFETGDGIRGMHLRAAMIHASLSVTPNSNGTIVTISGAATNDDEAIIRPSN